MWCLPNIVSMNARAAANVDTLRKEAKKKRKPACEHYGCKRRAVESVEWFDIFSDDPKGLIHVCAEHPADCIEGYFQCYNCERVMADHYTWERYQVQMNGRTVCMKCAAALYFNDPKNWIDPHAVRSVVNENFSTLWNPKDGILNLRGCPHVLAVAQPLPVGIKFFDNAEFDSHTGSQISGERVEDIIKAVDEMLDPAPRLFCPVMDAAYQFSVSIGIYIKE